MTPVTRRQKFDCTQTEGGMCRSKTIMHIGVFSCGVTLCTFEYLIFQHYVKSQNKKRKKAQQQQQMNFKKIMSFQQL